MENGKTKTIAFRLDMEDVEKLNLVLKGYTVTSFFTACIRNAYAKRTRPDSTVNMMILSEIRDNLKVVVANIEGMKDGGDLPVDEKKDANQPAEPRKKRTVKAVPVQDEGETVAELPI